MGQLVTYVKGRITRIPGNKLLVRDQCLNSLDLNFTGVDWNSITTDEAKDLLRAVNDAQDIARQRDITDAVHRSRYVDSLIAMTFLVLAGLGIVSAINALIWLAGSLLIFACATGFISSMLTERLEESKVEFSKMTDELTAKHPRNDLSKRSGDAS